MAQSALNLRFWLAAFGLVLSAFLGVLVWRGLGALPSLPLFAIAAVAVVDLVVVARRRSARQRAHRGADHTHDSLFE